MLHLLPIALLVLLFALGTWAGLAPAQRLVERYEAYRELEVGSASRLRLLRGWWIYLLWLAPVFWLAAFLGDWAVNGDLYGAYLSAFSVLFFLGEAFGILGP